MSKCIICGASIKVDAENSFIIDNVPDSTFDFSEETISLNLLQCNTCGAVQLYDTPLSKNYLEVYRSVGSSPVHREEKKQQLKEFIKKYSIEGKTSIEIGCGDGQFLEILKELGVSCFGVEAGIENTTAALAKGLLVPYTNISQIKTQYDALFTFYYLEHLIEPNTFVFNLYRILKPGGIGLIEVPNYDHIEKNSIWLEITKDHRVYYKKSTLCYLLSKFGFIIESVSENSGGLCMSVVVRKPEISSYTYSPFSKMKEKIKKDEEDFKNLVEPLAGNFAVYGAGHYSQLLLNRLYANKGIKPKYIFDSNKKKCGNKLCGITIEHKEDLTKLKNESITVVVICGMYNKEVENMLKELDTGSKWEIKSWN